MVSPVRNNKQFAYGVNSYIVDTVDELTSIQTAIGSTAIVNGVGYYLNNNGQWIPFGGSSGTTTGGGSGDSALTPPEVLALLV